MFLKCLSTGLLDSNCYIIGDSGEAVIIDAGVKEDKILEVLNENGLKLKYIILTHGHFDHIVSVDTLRKETQSKVLIHEDDANYLLDPMLNGSEFFGAKSVYREADEFLKHGDAVNVGNLELNIIHTPGHSMGGICVKVQDNLFTGDTLFKLSIGRTDLTNGDPDLIIESIKNNLLTLPEEVVVYPGHGESTTIGYEKKNNYFFRK